MIKVRYLLILMILLSSCGEKEQHQLPRPVQAIKIETSPVISQYSYAGVVKPRYEIPLAFQVSGKLAARLVDIGDKVKTGQLLAKLDENDLKIQFQIKQEKLKSAQSDLNLAKDDLDRYSPLVKKGYVTVSQLHQFQSKYDAALAATHESTSDLTAATRQLAYANLYSEADGVIIDVMANAGEIVNSGKPIMKMAATKEKEIAIAIPEQRVEQWHGQNNVIDVVLWANPAKHYAAKVREIDSDTDPATRTFVVKLSVPDADTDMKLGMTANVTLKVSNEQHKIIVPLTSIFYQGNTPSVWVINPKDFTVHPVKVELGDNADKDNIIINSGLQNGELIATAGVHNLMNGEKVTLLNQDQ